MNIIVITSTYTVSGSKSIIVSNTLSFAIARLHFILKSRAVNKLRTVILVNNKDYNGNVLFIK